MTANTEDGNIKRGENGNKCKKLFKENKILVLLVCLIILGFIAGILLVFVIPTLFKKEARPYRLPRDIVPYQYELEIKPYLIRADNSEFEGQVEIYVACVRKTDLIALHSRNLTIVEETVKVTNIDEGDEVKVLLTDYDPSNDLLLLRLLEDLKERNKYRIYIKYKGFMKLDERGFYISTYEDDEEITHYIASTHFEPDLARSAFPCFDEPEFKSTFNVTLVRWKNMTSLSNMPRIRTEYRGDNWEADIFDKSMRMSTYLVAFVFCDYIGITKEKVTVWAPAHRISDAEFALNVSVKALQFFESKLGIPYAGPKLDMIPVSSLEAAAMENWGLIIYEESTLLTPEDKKDTIDILNEIASTVAHEIAHQWFGNLVTPKWWSDIWLSEGITSYMQNLAMLQLFPEWNQIDPTISSMYMSIESDCDNTPPIWKPALNSKEVSISFEGVTYEKGSMITHMIHQILGDHVFWKGLNRYLKSNAYGNVEEADLWRYLTAAQLPDGERLDMAEIMHSWTHLSGMPIVTVNRDYTKSEATLSQKSCKSMMKEHENDRWNIPIVIETKYAVNLFNKIIWLQKNNMTIKEMPYEDEWIVVNGDSDGNYIVNYDRRNWNLLSNQLRSSPTIFNPTERYKFAKQIIMLESWGDIDIDVVFQHFLYINEEREFRTVWYSVEFLSNFLKFFDEYKYYELLREYLIHIWIDMYERVGWKENDPDTMFEELIRYSITRILCVLRYAPCVEQAMIRYSTFEEEKPDVTNFLSNNMIAMCTAVQVATYEEWKSIKDLYFNEEDYIPTFVLDCSNNTAIIKGELDAFLVESKWNIDSLLQALRYNRVFFNKILDFFDENLINIVAKKDFAAKTRLKNWKAAGILNPLRIEQIIQMLEKHLKDLSGPNVENVESFLELLKKKLPDLKKKARILEKWLEGRPWLEL